MVTFTGEARLPSGERLPYAATAPRPMTVGWAPNIRPGETWPQAYQRMFSLYPGSSAVRLYFGPGQGIGQWDGTRLAGIPTTVDLLVSVKDWPVDAAAWLSTMPDRQGRTFLCLNHEPEQGPGAGDPTREEYLARWEQLISQLAGHPRRRELDLLPIQTHYWAMWGGPGNDWRSWWSDTMQAGVDGIGWDVYHRDWVTPYDPPELLLSLCRDSAEELALPWLLPELGASRIATDPTGSGRAAWLTEMVSVARRWQCRAACWYHSGGGDLSDALPEQEALQHSIAEATPVPAIPAARPAPG